jgi:hypothetical protein
MIYRCYVVQGGRIIAGEDIDAAALDEAKTAGFRMVEERSDSRQIDGIEIWQGPSFLYKSGPSLRHKMSIASEEVRDGWRPADHLLLNQDGIPRSS